MYGRFFQMKTVMKMKKNLPGVIPGENSVVRLTFPKIGL